MHLNAMARDQIDPVHCERTKNGAARVFPCARRKTDAHSRSARHEDSTGVDIEDRQSPKHNEYERIPSHRCPKILVKERDRTTRHTARDAWQASKLMKQTVRPRQSGAEPGGCEYKRT
jgi:hypothetical protein